MIILPETLAVENVFLFEKMHLKFTPQKFPQIMFHKTSSHNYTSQDICEELNNHNTMQKKIIIPTMTVDTELIR